jgi:hypothetical protein
MRPCWPFPTAGVVWTSSSSSMHRARHLLLEGSRSADRETSDVRMAVLPAAWPNSHDPGSRHTYCGIVIVVSCESLHTWHKYGPRLARAKAVCPLPIASSTMAEYHQSMALEPAILAVVHRRRQLRWINAILGEFIPRAMSNPAPYFRRHECWYRAWRSWEFAGVDGWPSPAPPIEQSPPFPAPSVPVGLGLFLCHAMHKQALWMFQVGGNQPASATEFGHWLLSSD